MGSLQPCLRDLIAVIKIASKADLSAATEKCLELTSDCSEGQYAPIWVWDVTAVTDMSYVFTGDPNQDDYVAGAQRFVGDISKWDVSRVTNMQDMFAKASAFNGDISNWNVGSVTNMRSVFFLATAFNCDISSWDVSRVTTMIYMF